MISVKGFHQQIITLLKDGTPTVGDPATISSNNTATDAAADSYFIGVITGVSDSTVSVQMTGHVKLKYTGTTSPTRGLCYLVANGNGGVKVSSDGRPVTVLNIDTFNKKIDVIL